MGIKAPVRDTGIFRVLTAAFLFSESAHAGEPFCLQQRNKKQQQNLVAIS